MTNDNYVTCPQIETTSPKKQAIACDPLSVNFSLEYCCCLGFSNGNARPTSLHRRCSSPTLSTRTRTLLGKLCYLPHRRSTSRLTRADLAAVATRYSTLRRTNQTIGRSTPHSSVELSQICFPSPQPRRRNTIPHCQLALFQSFASQSQITKTNSTQQLRHLSSQRQRLQLP